MESIKLFLQCFESNFFSGPVCTGIFNTYNSYDATDFTEKLNVSIQRHLLPCSVLHTKKLRSVCGYLYQI